MVDERESMIGVESWPRERIIALSGGKGLPFVDVPGDKLPFDRSRDKMLLRAIQLNGIPTKSGVHLNYDESEALYHTVRDYFDNVDPLMNTERWMAEFVEKNGMTYTDHDGRTYLMDNGVRHSTFLAHQPDEEDDEDDEEDENYEPNGTDITVIHR